MPKAKLVTRSATTTSVTADSIPKNSGLTNEELDSNFLNLRDQGWRIRADDSTQHTITADTQVNFLGGTITADANGDITVSNLGGGATTNLGNLTFSKSTGTTDNSNGEDTTIRTGSGHDYYFTTTGDGSFNFVDNVSHIGISILDDGLASGGTRVGKYQTISSGETKLVSGGDLILRSGSSNTTIVQGGDFQIDTNGSTNYGQGELARFTDAPVGGLNNMEIDFNHNGNYGGHFTVYGSDGQTSNAVIPFQVNLSPSGMGTGTENPEGVIMQLQGFTDTAVPSGLTSDHKGLLICIRNSSPAGQPAYYDGSNWRYVHDNSTV